MIINMTTFAARKKHYIHETLESLFASDGRDISINLIVGSSDTSHIERYRKVANIVYRTARLKLSSERVTCATTVMSTRFGH